MTAIPHNSTQKLYMHFWHFEQDTYHMTAQEDQGNYHEGSGRPFTHS